MEWFFELEEEMLMFLPGLFSGIPSGLFSLASYILTAIAVYAMASRRGLRKPWLAWIPVLNCWLLGSLSDQYQYVVKGQNKSKRKWLLVLKLLNSVLWLLLIILAVVAVGTLIMKEAAQVMGLVVALMGLIVPLAGVSIAYVVIRYIALYDIYRSLDPDNSTLYLVMSILFNPTEPFFLFFNRDKDKGMPPRKQQPVVEPEPATWGDPEYL